MTDAPTHALIKPANLNPVTAAARLADIQREQRKIGEEIVPLGKQHAKMKADLGALTRRLEDLRRRQMELAKEARRVAVAAKAHRAFKQPTEVIGAVDRQPDRPGMTGGRSGTMSIRS